MSGTKRPEGIFTRLERRMPGPGGLPETLIHASPAPTPARWTRQEWLAFQAELFEEIKRVARAKNEDYAASAAPFANFEGSVEFGVEPLRGLVLRMSDKFQRLKSYCQRGELSCSATGDALEDVFRDLIGYSSLALGMLAQERGVDPSAKANP